MKALAYEIFDRGRFDNQIMAESVQTFDFSPNHQFANFPSNGAGQSVEDQLFVDTGDQFGAYT